MRASSRPTEEDRMRTKRGTLALLLGAFVGVAGLVGYAAYDAQQARAAGTLSLPAAGGKVGGTLHAFDATTAEVSCQGQGRRARGGHGRGQLRPRHPHRQLHAGRAGRGAEPGLPGGRVRVRRGRRAAGARRRRALHDGRGGQRDAHGDVRGAGRRALGQGSPRSATAPTRRAGRRCCPARPRDSPPTRCCRRAARPPEMGLPFAVVIATPRRKGDGDAHPLRGLRRHLRRGPCLAGSRADARRPPGLAE